MVAMRVLIFTIMLSGVSVMAQTNTSVAPKTPTEAWQRVEAKKEEEQHHLARDFTSLFKLEDWRGEELLRLGELYSLAGRHGSAQRALTIYLAAPKATSAHLARRVLLKVFVAQRDYVAAVPVAHALLAVPEYDRATLSQVVSLMKSLAATRSKEAGVLFEKTLPGLFQHARNEIKTKPEFGPTLAGMLLANALQAGRAYREAGGIAESEELFTLFRTQFAASELAAEKEVAKAVEIALRQARVVGTEAPPLDGVEYLGMTRADAESLKGKVVLLDFLAHWCKPCIADFPKLNALQEKYGPRGLRIIGVTTYHGFIGEQQAVSSADELALLKNLRAQHNVKFGFIISPQAGEAQYGMAAAPYVVTVLPTMALIDRAGKVRYLRTGADEAEIEKMIQTLIGEPITESKDE